MITRISRRRPPGCLHCPHSNKIHSHSSKLTQKREAQNKRRTLYDFFCASAPLREISCRRFYGSSNLAYAVVAGR